MTGLFAWINLITLSRTYLIMECVDIRRHACDICKLQCMATAVSCNCKAYSGSPLVIHMTCSLSMLLGLRYNVHVDTNWPSLKSRPISVIMGRTGALVIMTFSLFVMDLSVNVWVTRELLMKMPRWGGGGLTHCNSLFSPFLCLFSDPDDYIKSIPPVLFMPRGPHEMPCWVR